MDLSEVIKPGSLITWPQATGVPIGLIQELDRSLSDIGECSAFIGMTLDQGIRAANFPFIRFRSFSGSATNRRYVEQGIIDIVPMHLSEVPAYIQSDKIQIDVVFAAVTDHEEGGYVSLGVTTDVLPSAMAQASIIIGERVQGMPWTYGDTKVPISQFTHMVDLGSQVTEMPIRRVQPTEEQIARHIVSLIPNGATLQFGIGAVPDAVLEGLSGHRDLGVHTGILTRPAQRLIELGVITNRYKGIDAGVTTAAYLAGSQTFYDFCHRNSAIQVRHLNYTHNLSTLMQLQNFVSINSAFEVDCTGQVNAETIRGQYFGQVGGQVDFVKGSSASVGGFSIIGLASANRDATISRIVSKISDGVTTSLRTDIDFVVTEYGIASLRGCTLAERINAIISIAHPSFRDELRQASRRMK